MLLRASSTPPCYQPAAIHEHAHCVSKGQVSYLVLLYPFDHLTMSTKNNTRSGYELSIFSQRKSLDMINPKKALLYGVIAISLVVLAVIHFPTLIRSPSNNSLAIKSGTQPITNSNNPSIEQFKNQFCGLNSIPNSNNYVTEYRLPHTCEMPLGIAVDNQAGKVWYVSTKQGVLGDYNLITKKFDKEISIPVWNVRKYPMDFSNVWSVKVDSKGNSIWFTDEKQNTIWRYSKAFGFDMYKIPEKSSAFGTISPVSLDFDSKGNVYFVGIHSPVLL